MLSFVPFVDPSSQRPLRPVPGGLTEPVSGKFFPLVHGIPRFCPAENYSESFGYQWNLFDRTQLDVFLERTRAYSASILKPAGTAKSLANVRF